MTLKQIKGKAGKAFNLTSIFSILENGFFQGIPFYSLLPCVKASILFDYFKEEKFKSLPFEKKIACDYSMEFVNAVRASQVFLKKERLEELLTISLPPIFKHHQIIWKKLQETELSLWQKIESAKAALPTMPLEDVLYYIAIWIEESRFANNDKEDLQTLSSVYGFFIRYFLSDYSGAMQIKNTDLFANKIIGGNNPLQVILDEIKNWVSFNDAVLSEYCFDHEIDVKIENGTVYFNRSPQDYYRWKLDGVRYEITRLNYFLDAAMIVDHEEENGNIVMPKGAFQEDEDMNRIAAIKRIQSLLLLSDLKIESLKFGNQQISVDSLLTPLLGYSINRLFRYELKLDSLKGKTSNWQAAYSRLFADSLKKDVENDPWFLMPENEYLNRVANVLESTPVEVKNELTKMFSFNPMNGNFDRFNNNYDVWKKPFLKVGEMLFCPMAFLANNDWFYAFAQVGINNLNYKKNINGREVKNPEGVKSSNKIEKDLAVIFNECGFSAQHIESHQQGEGDVDLIIKETDDTLFIQLKRTYFKLDLQAQYIESIETDCHASMQLNMAEQSLSKENPIFELKHQPKKWIVTTSYEGVGKTINNCRKVNYFDLLYLLRNHRPKTIKELARLIEDDRVLRDAMQNLKNVELPDIYKLMVWEAGFPLNINEPKGYKKELFFAPANDLISYSKNYNKALELDRRNQKKEAIDLLKKCLQIKPNDFDALAALAKVYADIGDFKNSFLHFEEALKIIPYEPFVGRNYSIALMEGGRLEKGFEYLLELLDKYPFYGELRDAFLHGLLAHSSVLSEGQISSLTNKWNELN